jgi:hypothetical protein
MLKPMSVADGYSGVKKKGRSPRCGELPITDAIVDSFEGPRDYGIQNMIHTKV